MQYTAAAPTGKAVKLLSHHIIPVPVPQNITVFPQGADLCQRYAMLLFSSLTSATKDRVHLAIAGCTSGSISHEH